MLRASSARRSILARQEHDSRWAQAHRTARRPRCRLPRCRPRCRPPGRLQPLRRRLTLPSSRRSSRRSSRHVSTRTRWRAPCRPHTAGPARASPWVRRSSALCVRRRARATPPPALARLALAPLSSPSRRGPVRFVGKAEWIAAFPQQKECEGTIRSCDVCCRTVVPWSMVLRKSGAVHCGVRVPKRQTVRAATGGRGSGGPRRRTNVKAAAVRLYVDCCTKHHQAGST